MWFKIQNQHINITILAKPHAKKTTLLGMNEKQGLLISLHAKPHQGGANKELIAYLAKLFQLPKTQIILRKGEGSRHKQVTLPLTHHVQEILNKLTLTKK